MYIIFLILLFIIHCHSSIKESPNQINQGERSAKKALFRLGCDQFLFCLIKEKGKKSFLIDQLFFGSAYFVLKKYRKKIIPYKRYLPISCGMSLLKEAIPYFIYARNINTDIFLKDIYKKNPIMLDTILENLIRDDNKKGISNILNKQIKKLKEDETKENYNPIPYIFSKIAVTSSEKFTYICNQINLDIITRYIATSDYYSQEEIIDIIDGNKDNRLGFLLQKEAIAEKNIQMEEKHYKQNQKDIEELKKNLNAIENIDTSSFITDLKEEIQHEYEKIPIEQRTFFYTFKQVLEEKIPYITEYELTKLIDVFIEKKDVSDIIEILSYAHTKTEIEYSVYWQHPKWKEITPVITKVNINTLYEQRYKKFQHYNHYEALSYLINLINSFTKVEKQDEKEARKENEKIASEEQKLIFSWNNCFDKWKTIYTKIYNEFFDPTGWINDNINDYQYLITDTFAVGVLDEKKITDSLLKSLFHRIPIYIGANNSDLKNKVKEAEKECFLENRNGALSVIGTVAVFEQDGKKYKGKAISSHMFGLNFEGKDSADSKEYVESEKIKEGLKKQLEDDLYRRYYASMCATALYMEKHSIKKVKKCFPLIGLGCYLSVLCSVSKQYVRTATFQAIQKAHKRINEEIKDRGGEISILMFGFSSCDKKSLEDAKFEENQIDQTGNIFDFPAIEDEKCRTNKNGYIVDGEEVIELVNAWDDLSFIGNAQSNDCSIDGWYVTALDNYNTYFKNTSFLFNCFLTNRHLAKDKVYFVDEKKGFSCLYTCSSKDVETVFQGREAFFENDYMEQLEQVETTLFEVEAK